MVLVRKSGPVSVSTARECEHCVARGNVLLIEYIVSAHDLSLGLVCAYKARLEALSVDVCVQHTAWVGAVALQREEEEPAALCVTATDLSLCSRPHNTALLTACMAAQKVDEEHVDARTLSLQSQVRPDLLHQHCALARTVQPAARDVHVQRGSRHLQRV